MSSTSPSLSTARHIQSRLPPIRATISSRCQREVGRGLRFRSSRAKSGPNLRTQRLTAAYKTSRLPLLGDSVMQTAQFVESGGADVGIISYSLALAPRLRDQGRIWEVPIDAYPRREQGGVILSWTQDRAAAEAFRDFVLGQGGRAILRRH